MIQFINTEERMRDGYKPGLNIERYRDGGFIIFLVIGNREFVYRYRPYLAPHHIFSTDWGPWKLRRGNYWIRLPMTEQWTAGHWDGQGWSIAGEKIDPVAYWAGRGWIIAREKLDPRFFPCVGKKITHWAKSYQF